MTDYHLYSALPAIKNNNFSKNIDFYELRFYI